MTRGGQESLFPWENNPAPEPAPPASGTPPAPPPVAKPRTAPPPGTPTPAAHDVPATPRKRPPSTAAAVTESESTPPGATDAGAPRRGDRPVAKKEYYSISEVADIVGLPAHVLRYWETQFSVLNPSKNRSGNRAYQRKEIRLILLVKQLLYDEKYTVEGAKQKLEQLRRGGTLGDTTARALDAQLVRVLRDDLKAVLRILSPDTE